MDRPADIPPSLIDSFDRVPEGPRAMMYELRALILETAAATPEVGPLEETTKWGQISYLPRKAGVGTTLRLGYRDEAPGEVRLLFHCGTSLAETFRREFGELLEIEGKRAIVLSNDAPIPREVIRRCVELALTYHL